jgi:hypothetical protein
MMILNPVEIFQKCIIRPNVTKIDNYILNTDFQKNKIKKSTTFTELESQTQESVEILSSKLDSLTLDAPKLDSLTLDAPKLDSSTLDAPKLDSPKLDYKQELETDIELDFQEILPEINDIQFQPETNDIQFQEILPDIQFQEILPEINVIQFQPETNDIQFQEILPDIQFQEILPDIQFQEILPETNDIQFQEILPELDKKIITEMETNLMDIKDKVTFLDDTVDDFKVNSRETLHINVCNTSIDKAKHSRSLAILSFFEEKYIKNVNNFVF